VLELAAAEHDDDGFLALAQRILNGAIAALEVREVYLVDIDMLAQIPKWSISQITLGLAPMLFTGPERSADPGRNHVC
jgi:hypothetical protein